MEVVLNCYNRGGYGLLLHSFQSGDDRQRPIMFISYIERGSPSDKYITMFCFIKSIMKHKMTDLSFLHRSGVLQIGDRILAINEFCLDDISAEDANQFIRRSVGPLTLTVEFDVIGERLRN